MRRHLTYANTMATIAVFLSLAGTTYAVAKITGKQVVNGSLTGADIKNRSLTVKDLANGSVIPGPEGVPGARGPTGPPGAAGAAGANGVGSYEQATSGDTTPALNSSASATATCPAGKKVVGGGAATTPADVTGAAIATSFPDTDHSWKVVMNAGGAAFSFKVWAICAST